MPRPWKTTPDGKTIFRRLGPLVIWWAWVAFVLFNVADVIVPHHDYFSLELAAGLLAVTGVAYACALRPVVTATDDTIMVRNPIFDHHVSWGTVSGVYLGDSVELSCTRPGSAKDKTIYCWALYSGRRSRMRAQFQRSAFRLDQFGSRAARTPVANDPPRIDQVKLMAQELGRLATAARKRGDQVQPLRSQWAWQPIAGIVVPGLALLALLLAR